MKSGSIKMIAIVVALLFLVIFTGTALAAGDKEPIRIGQATDLSTEYVAVTQNMVNGVKMAVDEINAAGGINGQKIKIYKEDAANTASAAVNAVNKLINQDKVVAIMGPDLSFQCIAAAPMINKVGIPFYVEGTYVNVVDNNPWFFRVRPDDKLCAEAAVKFVMGTLGKTKLGVIYSDDEFGLTGRNNIVKAVNAAGGTVVSTVSYSSKDENLVEQLANLRDNGAESIIDWGHPAKPGILQRQCRQMGINVPLTGSRYFIPAKDSLDIKSSYGSYAVVDCMVAQDKDFKVQEWAKNYRALFNSEPEFHATAAYNAVYLYKMAVEKAGSTNPEAVKKAMLTIKDYKGITNKYTFNDSNGARQVSIIQLNDNALEVKQTITID